MFFSARCSSRAVGFGLVVLALVVVFGGGVACAVGLSTCKVDAKRNVTIGGQGGCGPSVEVDQDFTGASAFGDITIGLSGTLSFPSVTRELDLNKVTIKAGGTLEIGTTANPIGKTDPSVRITLTRESKCRSAALSAWSAGKACLRTPTPARIPTA